MNAVKLIIGYVRNNLMTIVDSLELIYSGIELIINGIARLIPGNVVIITVHDFLAKGHGIFKRVKDFLVKNGF